MSANGTIQTITWDRGDGTNTNSIVQAATSTDAGGNWSEGKDVSAAGGNADEPIVAMSGDGVIQTITWRRRYNGADDHQIQAATSTDSGSTWSDPAQTLSAAGGDAYSPMVAMMF
jgi:hypothetical protein